MKTKKLSVADVTMGQGFSLEFRPLTHILPPAEENIIEKKFYSLLSPDVLSRFSA
jgi:hypothetical protein